MKNCIIILITFAMALMLIGYFYPEEEPVREDFLARARLTGLKAKGEIEDYVVEYRFGNEAYYFHMKQLPPSEQLNVLEFKHRLNDKERAYKKALLNPLDKEPPS